MAINDLTIQIIIKNKNHILVDESTSSNNDIFWLWAQWCFLLEKRINDLAYKCALKAMKIA